MAFRRTTSPEAMPAPGELTSRMVGIGMSFAAKADADADIESTLVHASAVGMDEGDLRVLAVLTTWLGVHHTHVNADRLVRLVGAHPSERVARVLGGHRRVAQRRIGGSRGSRAPTRERGSSCCQPGPHSRCNDAARMSASQGRSCSPRRAPSVTAPRTCSRRRF
jgi:hypothetical protein